MRTMKKCWIACASIVLAAPGCGSSSGDSSAAAPTRAAPATAAPAMGAPDGTYSTPSLTVDELATAAVAAGYTRSDVDAFLAGDGVTRSVTYTIRLAAGGYTLLCAADGGPNEPCDQGAYKVVDDHTLTFTTGCTITFGYTLHGDQLGLSIIDDTCPAADHMIHTILYEVVPFTKINGEPPTTAAPATGLPEGSYRTPSLTVDQLAAAAVAAGFAQSETERALAEADLSTSAIYTIRLFAGVWTLLVGHDGRPAEVGMEGKYTVVDDHTVIFTDSCGAITYDYSLQGDQLSLRVVTDECPGRGELLTQTFIYQTAPFTRIGGGPPPTTGAASASSYASTSFAVPFSVALPVWLPPTPHAEQPNFVTWEAADIGLNVRFLVPVDVYPPGSTGTTPPPQDYLAYLRSQSDHGAHFADMTETTVGGRPATLITATTDNSLDGSLGCQDEAMTADDCWGLQPDLILRIAVIPVSDKTLLVWLRGNAFAPEEFTTHLASFEQMLASIRFSDAPVQPPPANTVQTTIASSTAVSAVDGVWRASWTYEDLHSGPLLDSAELNDENWGDFTLTFDHGQMTSTQINPRKSSSGLATFKIDGDTIVMNTTRGETFVMRWHLDVDKLTFVRDVSLGVGPTPFVIKPWIRKQ